MSVIMREGLLGDHNLTSYNYFKNKLAWSDVKGYKNLNVSSLSLISFEVEWQNSRSYSFESCDPKGLMNMSATWRNDGV